MSRIRANKFVNRAATGAPELTYGASIPVGYGITGAGGINVTGVVTAGSFNGNLTGNVTGNVTGNAATATLAANAQGLTGTPNITVGTVTGNLTGNVTGNLTGTATNATNATTAINAVTATNAVTAANAQGLTGTPNIVVGFATVSNDLIVTGNFTVNGTTSTIDTVNLIIEDKNIGIGSVATPSNTTADGGGITIFGGAGGDKTLQWLNSTGRWTFGGGDVSANAYYGDGTNLTGVSAGLTLRESGTTVTGGAATTINFSGATITSVSSGIATVTIASGGISTEAATVSNAVTTLDLSKQDHKVTATGITTITCSGGTEGESHTVRIVNSGIATVGFSTFFLFPSGSAPSLPTTSGAIHLISFTVHRVGTSGIGTQLLAGASLNFS